MLEICRHLALAHVDMMFHVLCKLGYGVSLDAAARGMGIAGKPEGMNGARSRALGGRGSGRRCCGTFRRTFARPWSWLGFARPGASFAGSLVAARCGRMTLGEGWLTVREALGLPLPDTSWMDEPWPRERFTGWMR